MYLGKDAVTGNVDLGKVSDVAVSSEGEVYYLVEKGEKPSTRYYFTEEDVQTSNAQVVAHSVKEFTDDMAKRSHFLCTLYGVEVRDINNDRIGVIDNFVPSPDGALVVIEDPQGNAVLGRYRCHEGLQRARLYLRRRRLVFSDQLPVRRYPDRGRAPPQGRRDRDRRALP